MRVYSDTRIPTVSARRRKKNKNNDDGERQSRGAHEPTRKTNTHRSGLLFRSLLGVDLDLGRVVVRSSRATKWLNRELLPPLPPIIAVVMYRFGSEREKSSSTQGMDEIELYSSSKERQAYDDQAELYAIIMATEHLERAYARDDMTQVEVRCIEWTGSVCLCERKAMYGMPRTSSID